MKDSSGQSKTELPTPKRLRDLRKKGQLPRSADLVATAAITAGVVTFSMTGAHFMERLQAIFERALRVDLVQALDDRTVLLQWVQWAGLQMLLLVAPIVLVSVAVSALVGFFQVGSVFALEHVKPQLARLNPLEGIKRLCSLRSLVELLKLVVKTLAIGAVAAWLAWNCLPLLLRSHWLPIRGVLPLAAQLISMLAWATVALCAAIAAFDWWFQRWSFHRSNRMTVEEVRREHKDMEGDPQFRMRRRQLHREMANAGMLQRVRKASVVLVNPTHIAVALYYEPGETDLPVVLAKGEGQLAQEIRRIAQDEGVPVLHDVALARGLHGAGSIDQYIPEEFIEPVAAILRWVRNHAASV